MQELLIQANKLRAQVGVETIASSEIGVIETEDQCDAVESGLKKDVKKHRKRLKKKKSKSKLKGYRLLDIEPAEESNTRTKISSIFWSRKALPDGKPKHLARRMESRHSKGGGRASQLQEEQLEDIMTYLADQGVEAEPEDLRSF